ncbi:Succinyl-diaminopimelate desuccinylase-like protein [Leptomonas pyrrhocoris]|uniref:Succinyl-diaminopimelate desuccinylase-like protein n=1 Tax=Leptomonas pyrrhocoris TaxID=157538 RepID=A0A0M9FYP1_LEPPY|nr:Succinyl-diaminopimelate desuccinylase-like protein [Leptomonas pyrrhocoris]KPA78795.1 Succinyl-diaminopimelate desuccinylase-like protein [Leptomonas pyrrhocoris]|eukprot:XP_015657234.1 Succinyl-diaminopimelate desuccinylase-like protein [Leptomonas pyrrhocoris]
MSVDWAKVKQEVAQEWDASIVPALSAYIAVPNQSPQFDPEWATNGLQEKAFHILIEWVKSQKVQGLTYEYMTSEGRAPFLLIEIAGTEPTKNTVLMYGHMDKQPPLRPWAEGLDPHKAVLRDGKLYGRGGADDGYAIFSAVTSISALQRHGIPHGRIIITIEAAEESGSPGLDHYMAVCKERIGNVDLMVCLDSGAMNYDQVWLTTSLRGIAIGELTVQTLTEGMHSGVAGGVVPDTFRITRELLNRIEDAKTGEVLLPEAYCAIPAHAAKAAEVMATVPFKEQFPMAPGVATVEGDNVELALKIFWKPSLTVVGANLPEPQVAGNVIRTHTTVKLSLRLPPLVDAAAALAAMKRVLEADPPYGAKVTLAPKGAGNGCATPELTPWMETALREGSTDAFGNTFAMQGMGGGIPFIGMLIEQYPEAQFVVTGVLGPQSNAHGPNEFLHVPYAKGLTYSVARVVAEHFHHTPK